MKSKIFYPALLLIMFALFSSCSDFLNEDPETSLSTSQVYTKIERVEPLVNGIYQKWREQRKDRVFLTPFMGNDESEESEAQIVWEVQQSSLDKYSAQLNSQHNLLTQYWKNYWPVITGAAEVIYGIENVTDDLVKKDQLKAEACFLRAANYFELVQYWGGVPMIDYADQVKLGTKRQTEQVIYEYIIRDLTFASQYLPVSQSDKNRVARVAAKALLGKVYLYASEQSGVRDYQKASDLFKEVINNSGLSLVSNYADLFDAARTNTTESIYEFQFTNEWPNQNQIEFQLGSRACGYQSAYWGGYETVLPTRYCSKQIWEPGDLRKSAAIRDTVTTNQAGIKVNYVLYPEELGPHIKKYEDPRSFANTWLSGKNVFYMRLADIILNNAECLNELGKTSEAVAEVNKVRARAWGGNLPVLYAWSSSMSKEEFKTKVLDERMRELCFEGWRRMDLIRTGKFVDYIKSRNQWAKASGTIQSFHQKYPIPEVEIKNNSELTKDDQNTGYQN